MVIWKEESSGARDTEVQNSPRLEGIPSSVLAPVALNWYLYATTEVSLQIKPRR